MKLLDVARERPAAWAGLVLALLAAGYFGFHALFVKVSRTVEMPFSGPARYDDYYVLARYLQERGMKVEATRSWPQPLTPDTALFWFTDDALPAEVRTWLAAGGRLWSFHDPDARPGTNAWDALLDPDDDDGGVSDSGVSDGGVSDGGVSDSSVSDDDVSEMAASEPAMSDGDVRDGGVAALATLPITSADAGTDAGDGASSDDADADEEEEPWDDGCGPDGCVYAAQFEYGAGCFTLVASWGLGNEQVHQGKTPAQIDALLRCPSPPRRVVIVSHANSPWFGSLLIEHAPHALVAAAICLLLWLWRAGRRFGPVRTPRDRARRRMLDHIAAVGRLALRVGPERLIASARRELRQRLLRRVPGGRELEGAALVAAVVQTSGQPEAEVTRALLEPPSRTPAQVLAIARSIVALWRNS